MQKITISVCLCACVLIAADPDQLFALPAESQETDAANQERSERRGGRRPDRGPGDDRRRPPFDREEMLKKFDIDGDGELDEREREALREFMRREGGERGGFGRGGFGGRGGPRGRPGRERRLVVGKFDWDGDGKLDPEERARARKYVKESARSGGFGRRRGPFGRQREGGAVEEQREPERVTIDAVNTYPEEPLYAPGILRTLFLQFPQSDWEEEMSDFYRTDVEVPADLIVDGEAYPSVGVRFRGNSSFFAVAAGKKRSLNISVDYGTDGRKLYGYKTLNLLNSHSDPSFLRTVLYYHVSRNYLPAPKANLVKVVINGESWGIYLNVQQFNKDFLDEWFGTRRGVRWKVPPGPRAGLRYDGDDVDSYKGSYQLKTTSTSADVSDRAWKDLVELCRILQSGASEDGEERFEKALRPILDIDRALWFIALDNVFMDSDGYISRASDFLMYQDPGGRFHLLPYDSNETFGIRGGGPGGVRRGRDGRGRGRGEREESTGFSMSPLQYMEEEEERPLISRLLSVPHLRARYLAHVRTIVEEWLDWDVLGPVAASYRSVAGDEISKDVKKLYSTAAYTRSIEGDYDQGRRVVPGIQRFVDERREAILSHPEIKKVHPVIESVHATHRSEDSSRSREEREGVHVAGEAVGVTAKVGGKVAPEMVVLYYSRGSGAVFESRRMHDDGEHHDGAAGDGVYAAEIPGFPANTVVHYYVEARAAADVGTTVFSPARAEARALTYRLRAPLKLGFDVRIDELMAGNKSGLVDPQGEHDDWIKLHNHSEKEIDLSGFYLSDDADNLRKWRFPQGTSIVPKGYLIVWADGDTKDRPGLHAGFKLSRRGESVWLADRDARGNAILDRVVFEKQEEDVAPPGSRDAR